MGFDGRAVVVTGAARGLGAAIASRFNQAGCGVVICDTRADEGEALAAELGANCRFVKMDVTEESGWTEIRKIAERDFGSVAVLVNNAGIVQYKSIAELAPAEFRRAIDVNLFGAWLGIHVLSPSMQAAGDGVIINMSSTAGMQGVANRSAYASSKWGLRGLTKAAAIELADFGIRVCSIHPGPIRTSLTARYDASRTAGQPIKRFGEPTEVAEMAWFIAETATYSTGSEFIVDGGALSGPQNR
jgi:3alpha(or 20beta)-hydroxysteroid dehydrogenase